VRIGSFDDHPMSSRVGSLEVEMVLLRNVVVADRTANHYMCIGAFGLSACVSNASCLRDHVPLSLRGRQSSINFYYCKPGKSLTTQAIIFYF
jgi:hypothetical protein